MFVHEALALTLRRLGVSAMFGVIGDGNLYLTDSFVRGGGSYFSMGHEAGAVLAAIGYSRTSGSTGVATVTHGPGLTNTVTALVEAVRGRAPIVVLSGRTPPGDPHHPQAIDQDRVVASTGAVVVNVTRAEEASGRLQEAFERAAAERMPVVFDLPSDLVWRGVDAVPWMPRPSGAEVVEGLSQEEIEAAVGLIASSRRPLVLAGRGAAGPRARAAVVALADRIDAPLMTTLLAKDLFRGVEADFGLCGSLSSVEASEVIAEADCVIALGASLNSMTTMSGDLFGSKRVVHVDCDRDAIDKFQQVTAGVVGDSAAVAERVADLLCVAEAAPSGFASLLVRRHPAAARARAQAADETEFGVLTVARMLDAAFPEARTLVLDGGHFAVGCFQQLHVQDPSAYVHTVHFGSIGLGMGHAIGAWAGAPHRPVLLVCGDGGFALGGLTEFATAVRHGVDLAVVVLNDAAYGAEYVQLQAKGRDTGLSEFAWPDFADAARGLGGAGMAVDGLDDLRATLADLDNLPRPLLIDVRFDPSRLHRP